MTGKHEFAQSLNSALLHLRDAVDAVSVNSKGRIELVAPSDWKFDKYELASLRNAIQEGGLSLKGLKYILSPARR